MMEWILSLPILPAIAFLYLVVLLRAGGTYALGRGTFRLANRGRLSTWLAGPRMERAIELVNRWGAPVVALSFLTVGFQTMANAAAGLTRMPLRRYLPALAIGGLAWAIVYATVGLAAIALWLQLFLRSPWAAVVVLAIVAVVLIVLVRHRRSQRLLDEDGRAAAADDSAVPTPGGESGDESEEAVVAEDSVPAGRLTPRRSRSRPGRRSQPRSGGPAAHTR